MINDIAEHIMCPICIEGRMKVSVSDTFDMFRHEFDLEDIDKIEDGIISNYWVFTCLVCGAAQKFNFRDIEKMARKEISKRVLTLKAKAELDRSVNMKVKYTVYCGVCNGYDSNGACPQKVYDECQLRRMPSVL